MNRQQFNAWGLELTPDEFAQALAALGTLYEIIGWPHLKDANADELAATLDNALGDAQEPLRWSIDVLDYWDRLGRFLPSARVLAEAWQKFIRPYREPSEESYSIRSDKRVRFEVTGLYGVIRDAAASCFWAVEELSRPAVGVVSVYVQSENPSARIGWNWPLQVGFLSDKASQELRESLEELSRQSNWIAPLVEFINLGDARSSCDLLLLPFELRDALAAVLRHSPTAQADCVLVLGRVKDSPPQSLPLIGAIQSHTRTGGVGLSYVPSAKRPEWFGHIVRELSHNHTVDLALARACREGEARPPVLMASRRLVQFARLANTLKKMSKRFSTKEGGAMPIHVSEENSRQLHIPEGWTTLGEVGKLIANEHVNFSFDAEHDMGKTAAEINVSSREILESAPPPELPERSIQTQVFDLSDAEAAGVEGRAVERKSLQRALRANAAHEVVVQIGSPKEGWMSLAQPLDESSLSKDETTHELTVVFTEPRLVPDPLVGKILLPTGSGDSTACSFHFHTGTEVKAMRARIIVLHRNRVLQTALLRANIVSNPDEAPSDMQIEFAIPEAVVRPGMADLEDRQRFDAVILLNHDQERQPGITKISDQAASFYSPQDLDKIIGLFDSKLTEIATNEADFKDGLNAKGTVSMLRDFAQWGVGLYRNIVKDKMGVDDKIAKGYRIQILSAEPEARLPLEFVYDRKAPAPDALLCEHAAEALEHAAEAVAEDKDKCTAQCPIGQAQSSVICPLGFWGLKKVLERHAHDPYFKPETLKGEFRLQSEPIETRKNLNVLGSALLAASHRVDKKRVGGVENVRAALMKAINQDPALVNTWTDWVTAIQEKKPSLLVLLTHTAKTDNLVQKLEISEEQWLTVTQLDEEYIRNPQENPAPLVVLMGCETGAPEIPLLGLVTAFRQLGAAIVVSTGATILGRHATPVTEEFVATLAESAKSGTASFGDVMLKVRQKAMAKGLPMVLCLMSYGDADWRIGAK
jgi:hypothetical protein